MAGLQRDHADLHADAEPPPGGVDLVPAPLVFLLAALIGLALDQVAWLGLLGQLPNAARLAAGLVLVLIGARFVRLGRKASCGSGAGLVPGAPAPGIAPRGIFVCTRNPIEQGLGLAVLGLALLLRSDWTVAMLCAAAPAIHLGVVRPREHLLARQLGDHYVDYVRRVPRYGWRFWPAGAPLRDWLAWTAALAAAVVAAYAAFGLRDLVIEAMEEPGTRAAALAHAPVRGRASLLAAARRVGLRRSLDVKAIVDTIERAGSGRATIHGWAAQVGGAGAPLTVLGFVNGTNVFATQTQGERADVTSALKLSETAARNVTFAATFDCDRGQKLVVAAVTLHNRYTPLVGMTCP